MPYLGNGLIDAFSAVAYQDLTGGSGTSFTLNHTVANANEIEVFVNNVRQEPSVAYTVAGTGLTMTGTIASSDDFYVVFHKARLNKPLLYQRISRPQRLLAAASHLQGMRHLAKPCRVVHRLPPYLARQPWILIASKILF